MVSLGTKSYIGRAQGRQNAIKNTDNKRISGTVRVSSSEYQMNKASWFIYSKYYF